MQHAITIGDLVRWGLVASGVAIVLFVIFYIIAAFGRGMSR